MDPGQDPGFVRWLLSELDPSINLADPLLAGLVSPEEPAEALEAAYSRFARAADIEQSQAARQAVLGARRHLRDAEKRSCDDPNLAAALALSLETPESPEAAQPAPLGAAPEVGERGAWPDRVVVFGDSWSSATGGQRPWPEQLADRLSAGERVTNLAVPGSSSADLRRQYAERPEITDRTLVLVHTGGNDTWGLVSQPGRAREHLQAILGFGPSPYHPAFANVAEFIRLMSADGLHPTVLVSSPPLCSKMPIIRDKLIPMASLLLPEAAGTLAQALDSYGQGVAFADMSNTILNSVPEQTPVLFFNEPEALSEIEQECGRLDRLMLPDGLHPTGEGHRLIADKVLQQCPELLVLA